jgi:hypothetical protein
MIKYVEKLDASIYEELGDCPVVVPQTKPPQSNTETLIHKYLETNYNVESKKGSPAYTYWRCRLSNGKKFEFSYNRLTQEIYVLSLDGISSHRLHLPPDSDIYAAIDKCIDRAMH